MKLFKLTPMLNISDIEASLDFYRRALDFEVVSPLDLVKEWRWATIRSGDIELMLSETESPPELAKNIDPQHTTSWPTIFYFYPDNVVALHQRVADAGFNPGPVEVTCYGMREFSVQDPDGHCLSFGEDADAPADG